MKKYSANGKGTGKLGGSVFVINHGVQIEREYNGEVSNPSTPAQVGQRSRFKLASQVSAALAPVIAYPRKGLTSPRNAFTNRNMRFFYDSAEGSVVDLPSLQLVPGSITLGELYLTRSSYTITAEIKEIPAINISRVVYALFNMAQDGSLLYRASKIVERDEQRMTFQTSFENIEGDVLVYAYGMTDKSSRAKAIFGNYKITSAEKLASLVCSRTISFSDFGFSLTCGSILLAGQSVTPEPSEGFVRVSLIVTGLGQITNEDITDGYIDIEIGKSVSLRAVEGTGWVFDGWYRNGEQAPFSTSNPLSVVGQESFTLIARFVEQGLD